MEGRGGQRHQLAALLAQLPLTLLQWDALGWESWRGNLLKEHLRSLAESNY